MLGVIADGKQVAPYRRSGSVQLPMGRSTEIVDPLSTVRTPANLDLVELSTGARRHFQDLGTVAGTSIPRRLNEEPMMPCHPKTVTPGVE